MSAIRVSDLVKTYHNVHTVDHISFQVEEGEIFGMLGPNGAGKTTTAEIIEGLRSADQGDVEILGFNLRTQLDKVRETIGVALQTTILMPNLTPWELTDAFGLIRTSETTGRMLVHRPAAIGTVWILEVRKR